MLFFLTDNKRKTIAHAIIIAFALQFILPLMPSNQLHADEGPATPEAAQFEPIDTSDLVNLFTGNFNYNVPLLEIPGPEGNWPINMSYHAGVNPNTEATWVGLGWTLNPGAINRFVNGYPDDYTGGIGKTHYYTKVEGHGYNFSASFGPVGIGISYDSYTGQSGVNMTLNLTSMLGNINQIVGTPLTGSTSLSIGTSGVGISGNIGMEIADGVGVSLNASVQSGQKPSFGGGISGSFANKGDKGALGGTLSYSNRGGFSAGANLAGASIGVNRNGVSASYTALSGTGVSFSSQSGGASFSVAGIGITSQAKSSGTGKTSSKSSGISIPQGLFGIPFGFSFGYYEWEWVLDETIYENSIGFMHQSKFDDSSTIAHSIGWPNYGHTYFVEDEVLDRANMYHIRGTNTALASTGYDYALDVKNMEKSVMEDHLFATEDV
ncbi:MAG: hypothetical protein KDC80_10705, partial [Saprospiraceae bacterium]|nr:hypothetical protein [Saprospiraceae bacterium]